MQISRRSFVAGGVASTALSGLPGAAFSASPAALRVAVLKFGSLNWLMRAVAEEGLSANAGLNLKLLPVATNAAGPLSLMAKSSDIIVTNWLWAMRQRSKGVALKFSPYSSALGAVMVAPDSGIKTLADLKGKRIGVAGSALDKSWLLLRAYSRKTLGEDIAQFARPQYGAAPLIAEELKIGRVDGVLNFWTFSARLSGLGFVPVVRMASVFEELGIRPVPAMVGYVWNEAVEQDKGGQIGKFLSLVNDGNAQLAKSDALWLRVRDGMRAKSDAEFIALREGYRAGIPQPWTGEHTASAERLFDLFKELGKDKLVGARTKFDPELFRIAAA